MNKLAIYEEGKLIDAAPFAPENFRLAEMVVIRDLINLCLAGANEDARESLIEARKLVVQAIRETPSLYVPYPETGSEEEDNRGRDRDEWRHEASEAMRLK